jgi:hypothetical protein
MTTAADDSAVEEAFEACLAGRVVPAAGTGLASFADAVRASATEPGRPSGALADLLATGLLTDLPSPSTRTARPARGRRRRIRMLLPALIAKIASAGMAAKAATGAGIVIVGLTSAGFTGSLPDPAQHTFATVVDSVTPLTAPDPEAPADPTTATTPATTTATTTDDKAATTGTGTDGADDVTGDDSGEPAHPSNFGGTVSSDAKDGGVDGQQVSQEAHDKNRDRKGGSAVVAPSPSPSAPAEAGDDSGTDGATSGDDAVTPARTGDDSGGSSHGSSGSGSSGSSGKGRSDH